MRGSFLLLVAFLALAAPAAADEESPTPTPEATPAAEPGVAVEEAGVISPTPPPPSRGEGGDSAPQDAPRLFLDCPVCDPNFIREEVAFVVYVRDRADADVQAIVSWLPTGAGGAEYTLRFLGLGRFAGLDDELAVLVPPDASTDDQRRELARVLRLGLSRYAARTRVARELDVSWTRSEAAALPEEDPWDHWVMRLSASGVFVGESSYRTSNTTAFATAARVTELWKIRTQVYGDVTETRYDLGTTVIESFRRDVGGSLLVGRGFGDHVTVGLRPSWSGSTYTNIRSQYSTLGLFEWSVFPYALATRRSLILQYGPRVDRAIYYEETIFEKEQEILFSESASLTYDTTQPWGTLTATLYGSHYFHDVEKASAYASLSLDVRLVRGLSLTFSGSFSLVRDQLYLPKSGATDEEVLLRRRQLATQFDYSSSVGLTYTFGSLFTPVVNTRLGGY